MLLSSFNKFIALSGYKFISTSHKGAIFTPYLKNFSILRKRFSLWIPDPISKEWYDGPEEDWDSVGEIRGLASLARSGDNVLEIGSHIGFYTIFLAQCVGPQGRIYGVEASPQYALVAQAQVGLNKLCERIDILNAAASDQADTLYFQREHVERSRTPDAIQVQVIRGDDLLGSFGPFDVLKLDVEGYEEVVLKGCREILRRKPRLALEIHLDLLSRYDSSVSALFDLIDIGNYHGTMMLRPDWHTLHDFSAEALPSTGVANLFLVPTGE
jgi:FkbM family methyltransferase